MQHFFNIHQQQSAQNNITPELYHNLMILEITNNWEFVVKFCKGIQEQTIKKVDQMQADWHNFIKANNINIDSFENEKEFMEKNLRAFAEK